MSALLWCIVVPLALLVGMFLGYGIRELWGECFGGEVDEAEVYQTGFRAGYAACRREEARQQKL